MCDTRTWAAVHEAGHAVATVHLFRQAKWLPHPPPRLPVNYLEITEHSPGDWIGNCVSRNIYSTQWGIDCIEEPYRPLMEAQIVIHLAGGIAEAMYRGERDVMRVFENPALHTDMKGARAVMAHLFFLTGHFPDEQPFASRAFTLLRQHWPAVAALAAALGEHHRIDGKQVEWIIDRWTEN